MKVEDFIQEFRSTVMDNEVPYFWTSENIVRYLNEAVQEACERAKLIEDRSTPSYQKEAPRLCRGGSRSLTFQEVVHRRDFQS